MFVSCTSLLRISVGSASSWTTIYRTQHEEVRFATRTLMLSSLRALAEEALFEHLYGPFSVMSVDEWMEDCFVSLLRHLCIGGIFNYVHQKFAARTSVVSLRKWAQSLR